MVTDEDRLCGFCGDLLIRKRGEMWRQFEFRGYCGTGCATRAQQAEEKKLADVAYGLGFKDGYSGCDLDVTPVFPAEREAYKFGWIEGDDAAKRDHEWRADKIPAAHRLGTNPDPIPQPERHALPRRLNRQP